MLVNQVTPNSEQIHNSATTKADLCASVNYKKQEEWKRFGAEDIAKLKNSKIQEEKIIRRFEV